MIIYAVTVSVEDESAEDWLTWMQEEHLGEVLDTGLFTQYRLLELLDPEPEAGSRTFNIQYTCRSMEDYNQYQEDHAPLLQQKHQDRYGARAIAFRTLLKRHA